MPKRRPLWAGAIACALVLSACQSDAQKKADAVAAAQADGQIDVAAKRPLLESYALFVNAQDAKQLLQTPDAFTQALSDADRALRLQSTVDVDGALFLERIGAETRTWRYEEFPLWKETLERFNAAMSGAALPVPVPVHMVRTTGRDEMGAHYTRGQAIVFPKPPSEDPDRRLGLFAHELFHVISRNDAPFRRAAYALLNAEILDSPVAVPPSLQARRITNPDAPLTDAVVNVIEAATQAPLQVAPMLTLDKDVGDVIGDDKWFEHIVVNLVVATPAERAGEVLAPDATDYNTVMHRNTGYGIHPDEVLADNFRHVVMRRAGADLELADPALVDAFEALMFPVADAP